MVKPALQSDPIRPTTTTEIEVCGPPASQSRSDDSEVMVRKQRALGHIFVGEQADEPARGSAEDVSNPAGEADDGIPGESIEAEDDLTLLA